MLARVLTEVSELHRQFQPNKKTEQITRSTETFSSPTVNILNDSLRRIKINKGQCTVSSGYNRLKDNKHHSLHLGRKYAQIFVLGHYLFLVAHSFPRATLSENCSQLGTDNVRGQIS